MSHKTNKLIALFLFVVIRLLFTLGLEEGDTCVDSKSNLPGVCKVLSDCPSAVANIKKRIYPVTCGFQGINIIICCNEPTTTTSTTTTTVTPPRQTRRPGEISSKKCREYAQYVWEIESSPLLVDAQDDIVRRDCPFDRLELIVGGSPASRKEFPHMAQIGFGDDPTLWACGATLISDRYILTAAHCAESRSGGIAKYARMGITDLDDLEYMQTFNIIERLKHPDYTPSSNYHDIALMKLDRRPVLNTYVRPACLYTKESLPWSNVIATGWGRTEFEGATSTVLLRVILEFYNQTWCNKVYKRDIQTGRLREGILEDRMICAGHSTKIRDTCQGDSGGPLQVYNTGGKNMTCMYDIIGITSFGNGCGLDVNIPGGYTKVPYYLKWIEDILWPFT